MAILSRSLPDQQCASNVSVQDMQLCLKAVSWLMTTDVHESAVTKTYSAVFEHVASSAVLRVSIYWSVAVPVLQKIYASSSQTTQMVSALCYNHGT